MIRSSRILKAELHGSFAETLRTSRFIIFVSCSGAIYSFTNPDADALGKKFDLPLAYNAKADKKSWLELQKFLDKIFGK